MNIRKGTTFDTPFETGCVAAGAPDECGDFDGYDSEGVLCAFTIAPGGMPLTVTSQPEPATMILVDECSDAFREGASPEAVQAANALREFFRAGRDMRINGRTTEASS